MGSGHWGRVEVQCADDRGSGPGCESVALGVSKDLTGIGQGAEALIQGRVANAAPGAQFDIQPKFPAERRRYRFESAQSI